MNNDTLIRNSHNHVKTTWDIINRESGRNKKRNELLALKFGDKNYKPTNYCGNLKRTFCYHRRKY
jgi:hypothetical protein